MAVKTCGLCADGWVCELHPEEPWTHHVNLAEACGVAMPCSNPTCPLSWATETDPRTGLVRAAETPDALSGDSRARYYATTTSLTLRPPRPRAEPLATPSLPVPCRLPRQARD